MALLPAFDSAASGTSSSVHLSKLCLNFPPFIRTTDWKSVCRDGTLGTPSIDRTCERAHMDRTTETVVGIPFSRMFEILRTRTATYVHVTRKAHSLRYIYMCVQASRSTARAIWSLYWDHEEVCREILGASAKLRRKIDHDRTRGGGIVELEDDRDAIAEVNSVVDGNGWFVSSMCRKPGETRHGDVIMDAVERQREKERLHSATLISVIGIWLMHYFLFNQFSLIFNRSTTGRHKKETILVTLNTLIL